MLQRVVAFLFISSFISLVGAQTPAGVQSSSNVRFWFNVADFSATANNTAISSWVNNGANTENMTQDSAALRPLVRNNSTDNINGFPVIRFDASNDVMTIANNNQINTGTKSELTHILTFRLGADINSTQILYEQGGGIRGISFYIESGSLYAAAWNDNNDGAASPWGNVFGSASISANETYVLSFIYEGGTVTSNGTIKAYLNGQLFQTMTGVGTLYGHGDAVGIGNVNGSTRKAQTQSFNSSSPYSGDLLEHLIYNVAITDADRIILENYLSAKYDFTLASNDQYFGDAASFGDYDFDVLGLAQDNNGNTNSTADNGGLIELSNPTNLGNNESLIIGHDNGSINAWGTSQSPDASNVQHLSRVWHLTETGDLGDVTFSIDGGSLPTIPSGYSVGLLVDDDGSLSSGGTIYESSVNGSDYEFDLNLSNGNHLAIVVYRAAIGFSSNAQSAAESASAPIGLTLNYTPLSNTNFTVSYATANGSAAAGSDYTAVVGGAQLVTFNANTQTSTLPNVAVTDDGIAESDETFTVNLTAGTGYFVSSIGTLTHTIQDNDNPYQVSFNSSTGSGSESVTSVNIPVSLNSSSGSDIDINYAITGGTATGNGTDYTLASGTATILAGSTSTTIPLSIVNDTDFEADETIEVSLSGPVGANLTSPTTYTYTIQDNDDPVISFTSTSQSVDEGVGSGTFTISTSQALNTAITVNYSASNGSANGSDYSLGSSSLVITPGSLSNSSTFTIVDDCDIEGSETFSININSVSIGVIGTGTQTITVTNNDVLGPGGQGCAINVWLDADQNVSTSSGNVTDWGGRGPNAIATSAASSGNRPAYINSTTDTSFNFQPYLDFDGTSDRLGVNQSYNSASINSVYAFVVFRTSYSGTDFNDNWAFLDYDRSEFYDVYLQGTGELGFSYRSSSTSDHAGNEVLNDGNPHIGAFVYDNSLATDVSLYADGKLDYSVDDKALNAAIGSSETRFGYVGDGSEAPTVNGAGNNIYYDGNIAEIFVINEQTLTLGQINQIHTYLGLKYGISLSMEDDGSTAGTDERDYRNSAGTILWDYSTNSSYANGIAGIARDDDGLLEVLKARSTSGGERLTISASSLANNLSLVWGHNNNGFSTNGNTPSGVGQRFERIYKADEVGETGNLTIAFDVSGLSSLPTAASEFSLLLDNDADFSDATITATASSYSSGIVTFTNIDIDDADYFTLGFFGDIVWNGSAWSNGSGPGGAPNNSDDGQKLIISGTGAVLSTNADVFSVEITSGSALTINSGITLTVGGGINNSGTINVQNAGSLVQSGASNENTGTGSYNVTRNSGTLADDTRFQYWSSPVSNTSMGAVFTGSNTSDFFHWNDDAQAWSSQGSGATMTPGKGYISTGTVGQTNFSDTRVFQGTANNGSIAYATVAKIGENILAGNPYPSAISSTAFVSENSSGISGTLYFWNHSSSGTNSSNDYAHWNGLGSTSGNASEAPDNYIQTGQSFFVEAIADDPTINFTNSMRIGGNNTQFFKSDNQVQSSRAWFSMTTDDQEYNQILIGFLKEASAGFDNLYDGKKYSANPKLSFYSLLDTLELAIQGLPFPQPMETHIIPLGVTSSTGGVFTISLDSLDNWSESYEVVLEDKEKLTYNTFEKNPSYTFELPSGATNNRFVLHVSNNENLTQVASEAREQEPYSVFGLAGAILIESNTTIKEATIVDPLGRLVFSKANLPSGLNTIEVNTQGIYLITLRDDTGEVRTHQLYVK